MVIVGCWPKKGRSEMKTGDKMTLVQRGAGRLVSKVQGLWQVIGKENMCGGSKATGRMVKVIM